MATFWKYLSRYLDLKRSNYDQKLKRYKISLFHSQPTQFSIFRGTLCTYTMVGFLTSTYKYERPHVVNNSWHTMDVHHGWLLIIEACSCIMGLMLDPKLFNSFPDNCAWKDLIRIKDLKECKYIFSTFTFVVMLINFVLIGFSLCQGCPNF